MAMDSLGKRSSLPILYQAEIYSATPILRTQGDMPSQPDSTRIFMIGMYGSEFKPIPGYGNLVDTFGFAEQERIMEWVKEQVRKLTREGKKVAAGSALGFGLMGIIAEVDKELAA